MKMLFLVVMLNLIGVLQEPNEVDVKSIEEYWTEIKEEQNGDVIPLDDYWEKSEEILSESNM